MEIISVSWDNRQGKVESFTSRAQAERFIEKICMKVAPEKNYSIDNIILS